MQHRKSQCSESACIARQNVHCKFNLIFSVVQDNDSPESHASYVWKNVVSKTPAKDIAIVAHSYGGVVTTHLVSNLCLHDEIFNSGSHFVLNSMNNEQVVPFSENIACV